MQFWTQSLFRDNSADLSGLANWFITALLCSEDADDDNVGDSVGFLALGVTFESSGIILVIGMVFSFYQFWTKLSKKLKGGVFYCPLVRWRARQRALWVNGWDQRKGGWWIITDDDTQNLHLLVIHVQCTLYIPSCFSKGSQIPPDPQFFWTLFKKPLTPPPSFWTSCCNFFDGFLKKRVNVCRDKIRQNNA